MKNLLSGFYVVLLCFVFLVVPLFAGEAPKPIFDTSGPVKNKIIEEHIYHFEVMEYTPPVKIKLVDKRSDARQDNPENALISYLSAMYAKDYNWWINSWGQDSREMMQARDKVKKRSPDSTIKTWERGFEDREAVFTHRVNTGDYVIIGYRMEPKKAGVKAYELKVALKKEGRGWFLTQDLAGDPVFHGWRNPEKRQNKLGTRKPLDLKKLKELMLD